MLASEDSPAYALVEQTEEFKDLPTFEEKKTRATKTKSKRTKKQRIIQKVGPGHASWEG